MSYAVEEERSNPSPKKTYFYIKNVCGHPEQCSFRFKYMLYCTLSRIRPDGLKWSKAVRLPRFPMLYIMLDGREGKPLNVRT